MSALWQVLVVAGAITWLGCVWQFCVRWKGYHECQRPSED